MGRLTTITGEDGLAWSCNGWIGRSAIVLALAVAVAGSLVLFLAWTVISPALGQIFGPKQDDALAWGIWIFTQVFAGNVAPIVLIGGGLLLFALFVACGGLVKTTCQIRHGQLTCSIAVLRLTIASRSVPLSDLRCFAAYFVGTSSGFKITADLHDSAPAPLMVTNWSAPFLLNPYRLSGDPGEPRRLLILATLTKEAEADQLVAKLNGLLNSQ